MHRMTTARYTTLMVLSLVVLLLALWLPVQANDETPTPEPTITETITQPTPEAEPTVVENEAMVEPTTPVVENEAPAQPTALPPTSVPPTAVPPTPTTKAPAGLDVPDVMQTYCQMNIDNGGDNNPFTYGFTAPVAHNIASFAWNFGDGNTANTRNASHTYTATGTFTVTLVCTPNPGFGAPMTLTGSVSITSSPVADFVLTPGTILEGIPPFTVSTVNKSTGGGLTYAWKISTSMDPVQPGFYTSTSENITYTFTQADFVANGFGVYGPATFYFHLIVTDGAGLSVGRTEGIVFNPLPSRATFNASPMNGTAPLTVTVTGIDLGDIPPTSWEWDFNGDSVVDATGQNPAPYTFITPGAYPIVLNYAGPGGGGTVTRTVVVYPNIEPVQAIFSYTLMGSVAGGIEVCFTNESTGPVTTSEWDFDNNGVVDLVSNDKTVCYVYATAGAYTARLRVSNVDNSSNSTATQPVDVVASPIAAFTVTPGTNITWGTNVSFTDTSTGIITDWAWDFNGDGVTDSTVRHPNNIALTQLGANPVRLTVTGPGGTAFVEVIIMVARLELTCAITGNFNVLPTAGAQVYNGVVGNQGGRAITYNWTITGSGTGLPMSFTTQNINVNWATIGFGAFQVTLEASTADGSHCNATQTVNRAWAALDCQMSSNLPGTLYADGANYTFNANVGGMNGRGATYTWYIDGVLQGATGSSIGWANSTDTTSLPRTVTVRYEVEVDNGTGYTPATSTCFEELIFTVQPWPTLTCNNITGEVNPVPVTPDNTTRSYNYNAVISGLAGRQVSYFWTVSDGVITTPNPRDNNNQATVRWNSSAAEFNPPAYNDNISVVVTVTNPDSTIVQCDFNRNVGVGYNRLGCEAPIGDRNTVVGEIESYLEDLRNVYGRPISSINWEIEQLTPVTNSWVGTGSPFTYTFMEPGATYRLRYSAVVDAAGGLLGDSCTSPWANIAVYGDGILFECESSITGNLSPANPALTYPYSIDIDNSNNLELRLRWWLIDYLNQETLLAETISTFDGFISSPAFTLPQLGPLGADRYRLRVDVTAVDQNLTMHSCSDLRTLNVGTITVDYDYDAGGWANTAVPVGQAICLTNISTAVPGSIDTLNYTWTVSGNPAFNSWGVSTSTEQQPSSCISFNQAGTYTIRLDGITDSTVLAGDRVRTFNVYGLQSILINRTGSSFAPSTQAFSATGTNITGGYSWEFRRVSDNSLVGTQTGANVNQGFAAPGMYRAIVSGNGPLGTTTAQIEFTLLPSGGLTAGFRASQYGGIAPMNVCFTDTSISGTQIVLWEWDFNGDGTFDLVYDNNNIPASICYDYTIPASVFNARLRVTNNAFTDSATNRIRTYNALESSATFAIQPAGAARFCFVPQVSSNVTVTGWSFGDGATDPSSGTVCHTYSASGSYAVEMHITDGSTTGTVVRIVVVTLTGGTPPDLVASGSCAPNVTATFTVTNNGGAMTIPDQVMIRDQAGNVILIAPLQLVAGGSTSFTVTGYVGDVTLSTTDIVLVRNTNCAQPPLLSGTTSCRVDSAAVFRITNSGVETAASQPYEVRDGSNTVVQSGTLNVPVSSTVDVIVAGTWGPLTLTSQGIQGATTALNLSSNCDTPPLLNASNICLFDGSARFTVVNNSPHMAASQPYQVLNNSGAIMQMGTLNIPANGSANVTVTGRWGELTLVSQGIQGPTTQVSSTSNCNEPAILTGSATCTNGTAVFTVENRSQHSSTTQPYTVTDGTTGAEVTSGILELAVGGSQQITVMNYTGILRLSTTGTQGATSNFAVATTCGGVSTLLSASAVCNSDGSTQIIVRNNGQSAASQPYMVTAEDGSVVQTGMLNIPVSGSQTLDVPAVPGMLTFSTLGGNGQAGLTLRFNCDAGVEQIIDQRIDDEETRDRDEDEDDATRIIDRRRNDGVKTPRHLPPITLTPGGVDTAFVERPAWEALEIGAAVCPDWLVYHTNMTGDWELFRLGNGAGDRLAQYDPNLSQGRGADVTDMAPTRSPDGDWIAFTSNRDSDFVNDIENWELYVAKVDNSIIRRLTYNTTAKDIDPVWSPDGRMIAFETDRDGRWELYLFDITTGAETRLTDHMASDINAFWTPDSQHIIFQSDRDGEWQIYSVEIATGKVVKLSDGLTEDHDPAVSFDGTRIAFRAYQRGSNISAIYVMNIDGTDKQMISNPTGSASNHTWAPDDSLIAYQSDLDGDLDIYVYEFRTGETRLVTDNDIMDYAPTWLCDAPIIVFTSDVMGDANIFNTPALPMQAPAILVDQQANRMTFSIFSDVYPQNAPSEENASREGNVPPQISMDIADAR